MGLFRGLLQRLGWDLVRWPTYPLDLTDADRAIVERVRPFTMTSLERLLALIDATRYVVKHRLAGSFAECGVWRGGSMMAVALTLLEENDPRDLYLYDTFQGMSAPTALDRSVEGQSAEEQFRREQAWCFAGLEEVRRNLAGTGYPADKLHFLPGKVEDTLPAQSPGPLALLRLDTDWYESTRHELQHLYPLLQPHGVLIIDDYGHWKGSRQATDEYFAPGSTPLFLHRIDYTGRLLIKPPVVPNRDRE